MSHRLKTTRFWRVVAGNREWGGGEGRQQKEDPQRRRTVAALTLLANAHGMVPPHPDMRAKSLPVPSGREPTRISSGEMSCAVSSIMPHVTVPSPPAKMTRISPGRRPVATDDDVAPPLNATLPLEGAGVLVETLGDGLGEKENGPAAKENRPDDWRDDEDRTCGGGWSAGDGDGNGDGEEMDEDDGGNTSSGGGGGAAATASDGATADATADDATADDDAADDDAAGCIGDGRGGVMLLSGVGDDGESGGNRDAMSTSMDDRNRTRKTSSLMSWNPGLLPDSPSRISNTFTVMSKSGNVSDSRANAMIDRPWLPPDVGLQKIYTIDDIAGAEIDSSVDRSNAVPGGSSRWFAWSCCFLFYTVALFCFLVVVFGRCSP